MSLDARTALEATTAPRPGTEAEFDAQPLRPIAHWVVVPGEDRLTCVWEIPNPQAGALTV